MGDPSELTRDQLLTLYRLAIEEYRFEINLGWERQKVFLAINPTLLGLIGAMMGRGQSEDGAWFIRGALFAALAVSMLGIFVVRKSHTYYQNAKRHFGALEDHLAIPVELRFQTTDGMREANMAAPSQRRFRVLEAVLLVLWVFALLDVILLFLL